MDDVLSTTCHHGECRKERYGFSTVYIYPSDARYEQVKAEGIGEWHIRTKHPRVYAKNHA